MSRQGLPVADCGFQAGQAATLIQPPGRVCYTSCRCPGAAVAVPDVSLESIARIGDDVVYREVEGEAVLLNLESGTYFGLDEVGTRIWQLIEQYGALTAVLDRVVSEFDVSAAEAATDLVDLVRQLAAHGLVELEG